MGNFISKATLIIRESDHFEIMALCWINVQMTLSCWYSKMWIVLQLRNSVTGSGRLRQYMILPLLKWQPTTERGMWMHIINIEIMNWFFTSFILGWCRKNPDCYFQDSFSFANCVEYILKSFFTVIWSVDAPRPAAVHTIFQYSLVLCCVTDREAVTVLPYSISDCVCCVQIK